MSDPRDDLAALIAPHCAHDGDPLAIVDAILAAGWRNFAVYRTETERNADTLLAIVAGGRPVAIVADRLSYWTGTEWKWAEPKPPTVTPPHDIDVERAPYCTVCGRDVQYNDDTNQWEH